MRKLTMVEMNKYEKIKAIFLLRAVISVSAEAVVPCRKQNIVYSLGVSNLCRERKSVDLIIPCVYGM